MLAVFLLSITCVSASEIDDTLASEDTNTIGLSVDNDIIEDNLQTSEENDELASTDYDEAIAQTDTEVLGADSAKYSDLANEIRQPGNIKLTHKNYTYTGGETITIGEANKVIDGNGAVIDMNGSNIRAFTVSASGVTIKNLTIINANYDGDGGAIYFSNSATSGTVSNCNFTDNKATQNGGAVYFNREGAVTNCNFINNTASGWGGAVYFWDQGTVTNCNFTNNTATYQGGAIRFRSTGTVSNCNFTDNSADRGGAINMGSGTVKNCNFTNNKATGTGNYDGGGAVYLSSTGNVTNCNFTDNSAYRGGAVFFYSAGNVKNCNFTNNKATGNGYNDGGGAVYLSSTGNVTNCNFTGNSATEYGGAVYFDGTGTAINCNFADNTATYGGAVDFWKTGNVTNCNFTGNTATGDGGAVFFENSGNATNCNFSNNSASRGGAILSQQWWAVTADTCIFKTDSDTTFNTHNLPPTLNVNNFTTVYGSSEKLTFDLKTNSSIPVTNGNISISVYSNNEWVGNYTCLSGEGWIPDLLVGSYIAVFDTEYAEFQEINRTVTITMPDGKYYVNVTSLATNNKTVNITAKTNVPNDIIWEGKLLFILPNGTEITANYASNGTWWAVHTFDAYDVYQVNATYQGLDNVTITNATISISKTPTAITVENETLELLVDDSIATGATLTPADAGNVTYTVSNSSVVQIKDGIITAVGEGTAIITVSFSENEDYAAAEDKTINVKVIKYDSKVTIEPINNTVYPNNVTIKYSIENKTNVTVTIDGVSDDKIIITNDTITVIGLDAGEYTITILNNESSIYHKSNDTKTFTVNKQATSITAADVSATYNINKELVITLKDSKDNPLTGASVTVDLNGAKTYTTDSNGQVKVSTKGLAPKAYTAKVTFNGNTNYDKSTKDVKVTVKKATPKMTAKKKTFKTSVKTKKYTITLKDNTGKAIKKAKVTLKVKSKTYKATTNSKGKAVFKIKNLKKKGTFKATITYKGNKYYNKITKKANIKVIVTFKTVSKGSKDKSTVKEIQQALKDHGYYLSYKGHYLKVDGKFQSCTERSVKEFQHDKGLKVTGKVDEKTAKKLGLI